MALERETDSILRILAEKTIADHDNCRFGTLMGADIPQGIISFFRAEIRHRLDADLKRSAWFTGLRQNDTAAARMAQVLLASLTEAYQFTRQEFLDTLNLSVHFVANYLCRPQWTLENFLFDRAPQITLTALAEGLTYVADYRYLGSLALTSLQRRGLSEVSREDFRLLIGKIDEEVARQHDARELAALARPLFSFFQFAGTLPGGAIPVDALLVFFEDKKLRILKEYVRGICHLRNKSNLTPEELTQLIQDLFAGKTLTDAEPATLQAPPPPVPPPDATANTQATQPLPPPSRERAGAAGDQAKLNVALSLTFAGLQGKTATPRALPEAHTLIEPGQRDRFVKHVFKGDAELYAGALVMLDSLKTWPEAETYLEELYRANNLDPGADDAIAFSDTIRRRFAITERVP